MNPRAVVILVIVIALAVIAVMVTRATIRALRERRIRRERARVRWSVEPRTLPSGDRQVWLTRPGDPDFLFATVRANDYGQFNETNWDQAVYDAEAQALEFDRLPQTYKS